MAKRRKLEAPSAEDISRFEEEFRRETSRVPLVAPISQVAAETASMHDPRAPAERAEAARDQVDAERLRVAEAEGLMLRQIPLEEIEADAIVRDRLALDQEELTELQLSISAQGMRLPVEVFELKDGSRKYGLLSGYRRLRAVQNLRSLTGQAKYDTIRAIVRDPQAMGGTFAAMVEENEVRANLSHFERGRIAVIAAQQGAFPNVEAAVNALFPAASKAKRSKVRSFALVFEELGDMLTFPEALREKDGLRIAAALREGHERRLRESLAEHSPSTSVEELEVIEAGLASLAPNEPRPERGGRPKASPQGRRVKLTTGVEVTGGRDGRGWFIRLDGARVDAELVDAAIRELARLLGPA